MARKPSALARELVRNFPKGGKRRRKSKRQASPGKNGRVRNDQALEAIDSPETGELMDPAELAEHGMSVVDASDQD